MDINRQQMARYLNGTSFPRKDMLQKICRDFKVSDYELFSLYDLNSKVDQMKDIMQDKTLGKILQQVVSKKPPRIEDGLYMTHFRAPSLSDVIFRSITIINLQKEQKCFRRLTGYGEKRRSKFRNGQGHHQGLVIEANSAIYFAAIAKEHDSAPSLLTMTWAPTKRKILMGRGVVITMTGTEVCDVVMEKLDDHYTLRQAITESEAIGIKEGQLPAHIRTTFYNL